MCSYAFCDGPSGFAQAKPMARGRVMKHAGGCGSFPAHIPPLRSLKTDPRLNDPHGIFAMAAPGRSAY